MSNDVGATAEGFSYAEKLSLVAAGNMDPKEIGVASAEEAQLKILGEAPPQVKLGDYVMFEASVVPLALRAHWAAQELKVIPTDKKAWEEQWIEKNKNTFAIQGQIQSGTCMARAGQIYSDPILGLCEQMHRAADLLKEKYEELKKTDPNPILTRDEIRQQKSQ